jgi:hypothetical protein
MTFKGFMPQYVSVPVEWETNVDGKVVVTKFERLHCKTVEEYKDAVAKTSNYYKQTKSVGATNTTEIIPELANATFSRSRRPAQSPFTDVKEKFFKDNANNS